MCNVPSSTRCTRIPNRRMRRKEKDKSVALCGVLSVRRMVKSLRLCRTFDARTQWSKGSGDTPVYSMMCVPDLPGSISHHGNTRREFRLGMLERTCCKGYPQQPVSSPPLFREMKSSTIFCEKCTQKILCESRSPLECIAIVRLLYGGFYRIGAK